MNSESRRRWNEGEPGGVSPRRDRAPTRGFIAGTGVQKLLYDDTAWSPDEFRAHLARSAEENGWNGPGMDAYDKYDEHTDNA